MTTISTSHFMISHEYKTIFIHIPKTAGTSIENKLGIKHYQQSNLQDHRTLQQVRPLSMRHHIKHLVKPESKRVCISERLRMLKEMVGIQTPSSRENERRATQEEFDSYFKFSIVRNPWARAYSWYKNVMRDPRHGVPACDFSTFINEYKHNWALKSQMHWIEDFDGSIPLDQIVKFENLQTEMPILLSKLGFTDIALTHHQNGNYKESYRSAYDQRAIETVATRYQREIERFGYSF